MKEPDEDTTALGSTAKVERVPHVARDQAVEVAAEGGCDIECERRAARQPHAFPPITGEAGDKPRSRADRPHARRRGPHMQAEDDRPSSLARLIAFSDSVFAFAGTLLVVVFPFQALPHGPILTQLFALRGAFVVYLVSFYSIGAFWLAHHRYFRYIVRFDTGLFVLNLAVLLFIAVLPFPTYLLAADRFSAEAAAFYAALLSLVHLLYLLLWWYACAGHRLVSPTLAQDVITQERVRRLLLIGVFVLSIGLALIDAYLALAVWLVGWLPFYLVPAVDWSPTKLLLAAKQRLEQTRR
jgi:uncharacterized membrane protein